MWYNFDLHRFAEEMLPPLLRGGLIGAILRAMMQALLWLYREFLHLRSDATARLAKNGQGLSLVDALRERYSTPEGDIYIVDSPDNTRYLYTRSEREDGYLLHFADEGAEPKHFYFEDEGRVSPDFYLYIPDYLQAEEANIYQLIGQYKPAGRTYEIIFYPYE